MRYLGVRMQPPAPYNLMKTACQSLWIVGAVGLALMLNACVVAPYPYYHTGPNEQRGAVAGAIGGGALGAIIGSQSGRGLEGAAIGGAIGSLAGASMGASRDREYYDYGYRDRPYYGRGYGYRYGYRPGYYARPYY